MIGPSIPGAAINPPAREHVNIPRLLLDNHRAYRGGPTAVAERQQARLAALVDYARTRSPFYRQLYAGLPERVEDPQLLPPTGKAALMDRFDDWVTDPGITNDRAQAFVADPALIGQHLAGTHGAYTVATTSGTTGTRGLFLVDEHVLRVASAIFIRLLSSWLRPSALPRLLAGGGRIAMVVATGGHFATAAAAARLGATRTGPDRTGPDRTGNSADGGRTRVFDVATPLPELVAQLNTFQPALLAPYATTAALLATEQQADRLHIRPALVALAAEGLPDREPDRIAQAFGATVGNSYAATECPFLAYSCRHGWLHVNADWVIVEPVDADHHPTPPGQQSHTVLITNLANRVQPILRYDLGDSVLARPDACTCGNPLPAIRIQGRTADSLTFPNPAEATTDGGSTTITPLALTTRLDQLPEVALFQIVQTAPTELSVRLQPAPAADPDRTWAQVHQQLTDLLAGHGLLHIAIHRAAERPQPTSGGKYRLVHPYSPPTPGKL